MAGNVYPSPAGRTGSAEWTLILDEALLGLERAEVRRGPDDARQPAEVHRGEGADDDAGVVERACGVWSELEERSAFARARKGPS